MIEGSCIAINNHVSWGPVKVGHLVEKTKNGYALMTGSWRSNRWWMNSSARDGWNPMIPRIHIPRFGKPTIRHWSGTANPIPLCNAGNTKQNAHYMDRPILLFFLYVFHQSWEGSFYSVSFGLLFLFSYFIFAMSDFLWSFFDIYNIF